MLLYAQDDDISPDDRFGVWVFSPIDENDVAVKRINKRRGKPAQSRVPFGAWVKEMNIDILPETNNG